MTTGAPPPSLLGIALPAAAVAVALIYVPALASPFVEPKLTVLMLIGALGWGTIFWAWARGTTSRCDRTLAVAAGAVLLTTLAASLAAMRRVPPGAPYAVTELLRGLAAAGVAAATGLLATGDAGEARRRRLLEAIHAAAGLVALIGLAQHARLAPLAIPSISVPGSTFGNRNVAAEAVAMAIPFGLALLPLDQGGDDPRRRSDPRPAIATGVTWIFLALELGYLAAARARGAWLGGALGVAAFCLLRRPSLSRTLLGPAAALAAVALAAALLPGRWTSHDARDVKRFEPAAEVVHEAVDPTSPVVRTRLGLWRRTWAMFGEHPLWGVGPGNFPVLFPLYAEPDARRDGILSPTLVPRRAHDDLLERLVETGPLGLGALLGLFGAAGVAARRRARAARQADRPDDASATAAAGGSLAALLGAGLTGFPLAMPATVFLFGVALGLLAFERRPEARPGEVSVAPGGAPAGAIALATLLVLGVGWWSGRRLQASYWLRRADADGHRGGADDTKADAATRADLQRAARAAPGDFFIALRASAAALAARRPAEAAGEARRALGIEPASPNAWEAQARAAFAAGDPGGAVDAADRALSLLQDYPGALITESLAAARLGDVRLAASARARLAALATSDPDARQQLAALDAAAR